MHSNGNITKTMTNLCTRAWKGIFKIYGALKNIDVQAKTKLQLFDKLVNPILCYSSEIWGCTMRSRKGCNDSENDMWKRFEGLPCEKLHLKYCKGLLGVHRKSCNAAQLFEGSWEDILLLSM